MTLEWVGSIPGKREYRRFVGDYVLNQNDIIAQEPFHDRIAFGGWSIDLHPPQGMYAEASGSKHMHADGNYHIPYRSLYTANVGNLLFDGRNISASHVAFGTTRVMATCAVIGEAAGTAASLCAAKGVSPREIYRSHLQELQQTLLRQDASVIGLRHEDERDLARLAQVSASSFRSSISVDKPHEAYRLERDAAILFPVDPAVEPLTGILAFEKGAVPNASANLEEHDENQLVVAWSMKAAVRQPFCFKVKGRTEAYAPEKAVGGYKRPFGGPNMWTSEPIGPEREAWLQLTWEHEISMKEIMLTWNDDVNEDLINLHHHRTSFDIIPELVKSYRIEARVQRQWRVATSVGDNRSRSNRIRMKEPVLADALRIVIEETNGAPCAELVEIRVY